MTKKRKGRKIRILDQEYEPAIQFEIEKNAEELFHAYLKDMEVLEVLNEKKLGEHKQDVSSTKKQGNKMSTCEIDLHGFTLDEACSHLDKVLNKMVSTNSGSIEFKIITGKGIHSGPGGGVLAKEVHRYIRDNYGHRIIKIDESPHQLIINGLPLKGYFKLVLMQIDKRSHLKK